MIIRSSDRESNKYFTQPMAWPLLEKRSPVMSFSRWRGGGWDLLLRSDESKYSYKQILLILMTDSFAMQYHYDMGHICKVLVADDHPIVLAGIKQTLHDAPGIVIAGDARTGEEVLRKVRRGGFDMLVLDFRLPGPHGLDLLRQIKEVNSVLPVLFLSMYAEDQFAVRLLRGGASGYITKESAPEELVQAIRKVCAGGKYISAQMAEKLVENLAQPQEDLPHQALSGREHEVLCLIGEGHSLTEIAEALHLSVKTVSTYRARILQKMRLKSTADLIRYALQHSLAE